MLNTKHIAHTLTEITLARHKLWKIEGDRRGDVISCRSGNLWITQEGDLKDYVVAAGRDFWVTRRGEVIVQALEDSQFKYSLNELPRHVVNHTQPKRHTPLYRSSQRLR